jgi:hypothetical protein
MLIRTVAEVPWGNHESPMLVQSPSMAVYREKEKAGSRCTVNEELRTGMNQHPVVCSAIAVQ